MLGEVAARNLPLKLIRLVAAGAFAATGVWVLVAG
jgi:putative Ca2+/H+ antiporter (TMEM165/GDT1 family)